MPGRRSEILWTPSAKVAVRNAGRGSRPGFSSSARMSVTVGSPNRSSTNSLGVNDLQLRRVADQRRRCRSSRVPGCGAPPGRPRGARRRRRAGRRRRGCAGSPRTARTPSGPGGARRRAPCGCGTGRWRRGGRRCCAASDSVMPDTRAQQRRRGGVDVDADGVHAVLDHGVERAGQRRLGQVVLVLPDADRLGVDLDQLGERVLQAPGDGDRAAQRHVQLGQLGRGVRRGRVHRRARLAHHHLARARAPGCAPTSSPASLSVSREAVPLPIAIELDVVGEGELGQRGERGVPGPARLVRVDRVGGDDLAGGVDDGDLDARCAGPGRGPSWCGCRPGRRAAGRAGWSRTRRWRLPRPRAQPHPDVDATGAAGCGCARPSGRCRRATGRRGGPRRRRPRRRRCALVVGDDAGLGAGRSSGSSATSRTSSFSPRNTARIRCEGSLVNGSAKSK